MDVKDEPTEEETTEASTEPKEKTILTGNQILLFMTSLIRMNWLTKLSIMLASKIVVLLNKQYCVVQVLFHTVIITKMMKQTMVK